VEEIKIKYKRIKQENKKLINQLRIQNNGKRSEGKLQYNSIKQEKKDLFIQHYCA
jgi:hypothetical protein